MINQNYNKLVQLKLFKMSELYLKQSNDKAYDNLSFDERLSLLVDAELNYKLNNHISRLLKNSNMRYQNATISDIKFYPDREIDKKLTMKLAECDYIENGLNVICIGATGAGKTYYVCALGSAACNKEIPTKYFRLHDLLLDIEISKKNDTYKKKMSFLGRVPLLIIDDFLLTPLTIDQQVDLLELLEIRSEENRPYYHLK